jgi:uncharacterized membrane protein
LRLCPIYFIAHPTGQAMLMRLALVALVLCSPAQAAEPSFRPFPDLPGGGTETYVTALSANGDVAVGHSFAADNFGSPFRWTTDGGIVALSPLQGDASDVSADGSVIVGRRNIDFVPTAFRWSIDNGFTDLAPLRGGDWTWGLAVSSDGRVIVGESGFNAVRWVDGGNPVELTTGSPSAVSSDGSVVVGDWAGPRAFRWTESGGAMLLGSGAARDMTPDGRVVVGIDLQGGFRWMAENGFERLGAFKPVAISDDARVMVGFGPEIWIENTGAIDLQSFLTGLGLDLTGWTLTSVTAISGDGATIAGQGIPPDPSMSGAWIAVIPEPSTWLLAVSALTTAILSRLRRRLRLRSCQ